jgi:hypothetical protein
MPFQTAAAFRRLGWRIERRLLWLPIGSKANLEVLLLFLLSFDADVDLLNPRVLCHCLFVLRDRFLHFRDTLLQLLILCVSGAAETNAAQKNERNK